MSQFKYQFPIAVLKREELVAIYKQTGRKLNLPKDVSYFEVRVPQAFNPLLIDKNEPNATEIAKGWGADGVTTELV